MAQFWRQRSIHEQEGAEVNSAVLGAGWRGVVLEPGTEQISMATTRQNTSELQFNLLYPNTSDPIVQ